MYPVSEQRTYDIAGNVTEQAFDRRSLDPSLARVSIVYNRYDREGNVLSMTDPQGRNIVFYRDPLGRVARRFVGYNAMTYDGTPIVEDVLYDSNGRIDGIILPHVTEDLAYHPVYGFLTAIGAGGPLSGTSYTYYHDGSLLTVREGSRTATFEYDVLRRLTKASGNLHVRTSATTSTAFALNRTLTYDRRGNVDDVKDGSTITDDYGLNPNNNRLVTVNGSSVSYEGRGHIRAYGNRQFTHDAFGRVSQAKVGATSEEFVYDASGEKVGRVIGNQGTQREVYFHTVTGEQLAVWRNYTQAWRWTTQLTMDGRPVGYVDGATGNTRHWVHLDHLGSTRAVTGYRAPQWVCSFLDETPPLCNPTGIICGADPDTSCNSRSECPPGNFICNGLHMCEATCGTGQQCMSYRDMPNQCRPACASGTCTVFPTGNHYCYAGQDHYCERREAYTLETAFTYEPFGGAAGPAFTAPATDTSLRFTGQELDPALGIYDYGARYYDPALRRFVQADSFRGSASDAQSQNRYAYALNNPLRYTDPTGHCPQGQEWSDEISDCAFPAVVVTAERPSDQELQDFWFITNAVANGAPPYQMGDDLITRELALQLKQAAQGGAYRQNTMDVSDALMQGVVNPFSEALAIHSGGRIVGGLVNVARRHVMASLLRSAPRVSTALTKGDYYHRAASYLTDQVRTQGQFFWHVGKDGTRQILVQAPANLGAAGRVEYLINELGQVTHQLFIRGGAINGLYKVP